MEATSITELLKGFCDTMPWQYAVFWKLNQLSPMTLNWESGYQKSNEPLGSMWGDINFESTDDVYSSRSEGTDDVGDYSVRLLMIEMSHRKYSLGEGVVGKLALAKEHFWVSSEDIFTGKFDTSLLPECPDEWLLQFASGIKTIVLVPVLPQGVLQFGSFKVVAEDREFVTNIKEKFHFIHSMEANTSALNYGMGSRDWSFSDLSNYLMDSIDESSAASTSLNMNESARFPQDEYLFSRETQIKSLKRANENQMFSSSFETETDPTHIGYAETKPSHLGDEIWPWSHFIGNEEKFGETSYGLSSYSDNNMTGHVNVKNFNDFSSVSSMSAFDKAAGLVDYRETGKCIPEYISNEDTFSSSTLISNKKEHDDIKSFELPEGLEPEYLLDAVVGDLYSASDETSCRSNSFRSRITMPSDFTGSILPKIASEESMAFVKNSDVGTGLMPAVTTNAKDIFMSSFDGNSSLLIDEAPREQVNNHMVPISRPKLSSVSKKKAKVGNKKNSRPRDRQLIMDRMKELRELIPDGGRCSIDNLLERTVQHMMYLRMVTSHAEKLKRFADREVPGRKRQKTNGSHPGRSCAFDLESEQSWPIVIEDLESSGHMLIEMVCNEHGLFLEIAQVIRKLDITILKGILENRSSTSWACFIVEVPRGFHRMDILCPLLHLLQLRRNYVS
ncbi:transcription factor bHLH155-like [Vicia villosa]|uniref:transcription factor bHLH155-like n=1 Tax=Vicia villosa TaxID=3911 RepID=UPI00273CB933|nr:transcription factor bHLH155-like [Vicia villosa]